MKFRSRRITEKQIYRLLGSGFKAFSPFSVLALPHHIYSCAAEWPPRKLVILPPSALTLAPRTRALVRFSLFRGLIMRLTSWIVGVWQNDRVEIIANDQGNRTTPSYVAFTDTERLVGDAAKNQVAMNPANTGIHSS